jgi:aspartate 1-decarboxylase
VIVMAYAQFEDAEARAWQPRVVHVDRRNRVVAVAAGVEGGVYEAC